MEAAAVGWSGGVGAAKFDASAWMAPVVVQHKLGAMLAQSVPPIRRQGEISPTVVPFSTTDSAAGNTTTILDTGKNHAGTCRFRFAGTAAGDVVAMRFGELLHGDGSLNPMTSAAGQIKGANPKQPCQPPLAFQGDVFTLSGKGRDEWTPAWSWHGYRYIEVTMPAGVMLAPDSITCYPMRTDVDLVTNFSSSDPFLTDLRTLTRNTFDSNMMSVQSDCPHRERFGYGGGEALPLQPSAQKLTENCDCRLTLPPCACRLTLSPADPLGCGEAGLSIYDWATFYSKRVRDFNDAARADGGFTETSPFVGITDAGLVAGAGTGPIGWETYQPVTQLWLYKYYGDTDTMKESFDATYAYIKLLDTNPAGIGNGLGDWMPVEGTSTEFTGPGFQRMSYLAFANITEILGKPDLAAHYRGKVGAIDAALNTLFLNNDTGVYAASGARSFGHHPSAETPVEGVQVQGDASYFCGESTTNKPPNPGMTAYQTMTLECPGSTIAEIDFAKFGVPQGTCGSYTNGTACPAKCPPYHCDRDAKAWVVKTCVGKASCSLDPIHALGDTCPSKHKKLAVQARCKSGTAGKAVTKRGAGPPPAPPPGPHHGGATQTGQGMALFMDIVPQDLRAKALAVMADNARSASNISGACQGSGNGPGGPGTAVCKAAKGGDGPHMTAGLFGIKWFLMSLADGGLNDLAYDVLTTPTWVTPWTSVNQTLSVHEIPRHVILVWATMMTGTRASST